MIFIVGQGIAGSMLAFEFMGRGLTPGRDFLVIDAGMQHGSSAVSTGLINPLVFKRMTLSWGADLVGRSWNAYRRMSAFLAEQTGNNDIICPHNTLRRLPKARDREIWNEQQRSDKPIASWLGDIHSEGTGPASSIDSEDADAWAPIVGAGRIKVKNLLTGMAAVLQQSHALLSGHYRMPHSLWKEDFSGSCELPEVDAVVLCTGIQYRYGSGGAPTAQHSYNLPDVDLEFYPVKGDVLQLSLPEVHDKSIRSFGAALIPEGNGSFLLGSSYVRDFTDRSDQVCPDSQGQTWLLGQLAGSGLVDPNINLEQRVIGQKAGIRPASRDRLAYLGPLPDSWVKANRRANADADWPRFWAFNGLGTRGVMLAPALAELLASAILKRTGLPSELDPGRLIRRV